MNINFDQVIQSIKAQLAAPKEDLEKNLRALLEEMVKKMDLVTQDELLHQKNALEDANQKIAALQQQLQQLEAQIQHNKSE